MDRLTLLPKSKMPVPWFAKGVLTVTLLWAIPAPLLLVATTKVESSTLLFFVTDSLTDGLADDPAKLIAVCPESCPVKLFSVMAVLLAGPLLMNTPVPHCGPRVPAPAVLLRNAFRRICARRLAFGFWKFIPLQFPAMMLLTTTSPLVPWKAEIPLSVEFESTPEMVKPSIVTLLAAPVSPKSAPDGFLTTDSFAEALRLRPSLPA